MLRNSHQSVAFLQVRMERQEVSSLEKNKDIKDSYVQQHLLSELHTRESHVSGSQYSPSAFAYMLISKQALFDKGLEQAVHLLC